MTQRTTYPLRMVPELRERLEAAAEEAGRPLNVEIVRRLEASFDATTSTDPIELLHAFMAAAAASGINFVVTVDGGFLIKGKPAPGATMTFASTAEFQDKVDQTAIKRDKRK